MKFDINAARSAGYSDDEIADYLAQENNFDLEGALKSGYSASEVVGFLSGGASAAPAPAPAPAADTGDDMARMLARNPAPKRPSRSMSDAAKDAGITLLKGAIGLPESFVGLADIAAQGRIGKFLEEQGYRPGEAKQILDSYLSEAQKAANREVQQADGFVPTVKAALQNPSTIATAVGESLPQMLGGAGVARGVMRVAPKVAPLVAGAIGEAALGAGSAASQIRGESKDGLLTPEQSAAALASGVGTAALGIAGGKVAQRFGFDDVETMLARGSSVGPAKSVADFTKRVAAAGFSEGVLEEMPQSAQEKLWENYALGKPLTEGVGAAAGMGLVTGAAMGAAGGGGGAISSRLQTPERQVARELSDALEGGQFTEQGIDQAVADRLRTESVTGNITPAATTLNFTAPDSPTSQAGLTPITVPVPSAAAGTDAALAAVSAGQALPATVGAGQQTAGLARPFNRATDQDLLSRTEAAVAAKGDNNAVAEPTRQWFGRKGDGYATEADALQAIAGRQRMFKDLDWKVELMPSGKFRLAGYEQNVQVPTEASTPAATRGGLPAARAAGGTVEAAGAGDVQFKSLSDNPEKWALKNADYPRNIAPTAKKVGSVGEFSLMRDTRPAYNEDGDGRIVVLNRSGEVVGDFSYGRREDGKIEATAEVAPAFRRQGIATAVYDEIERATGEKLAPAESNTPYAQAFWANRNAQSSKPTAAPILQNRDRSTPTSVVQMQSIAAKPDYGRLGFSRDFANGAPVVAGGQVPAEQLGKQDVAVASDGRRIPVQYAVMEAQDVLPSNRVDGTPNAEYGSAVDRVRAIAGNGRVAGLQAAFEKGTAGNYVQELSADNLHGISPQVIAGMKQPVLVRVMPTSAVTADIGDVSNTTGNLTLSPAEQAKNDGQRVALDALQFAEDGSIMPEAVRQFVRAMPQAEQGGLIDTNGQPTKQAVERLNAAVFSRAYGNDQIVRLFAQAQDPEARLIMSALAQAAPRMARLEGAGALDIRGLVTDAVEIAINARRNGISLQRAAEQLDMTADPDVAVLLNLFARNNRSNKKVVEALNRAADFAYSEANKSDTDMFGEVPRASRSDVINQLETQDEQASQATLEDAAGGFFAEQDAGRRGADGQGSAAPDQAQAGRAGQAQGVSDGTQAAEALQSRSQRQEEAADAVDRFAALEQSQGRLPESEIARLGGVRGAPQARLSAQQLLNRYSQQSGAPAPQLGTPDADAEETVNVLGNLFGAVTGIGPSAIAYKEVGGDNGFSLRGVAFINTAADTDVSAPRTTLHELKHVVEQIARADTKAGRSNTPAQQFVQSIDSIFDEMTDVGKRAYVENFLHKADLAKIADPAKREAAIQKYLASPLLRSEMTADFLGNRAQDRAFLIDLARQDPGGFEGFVQRWLAVIDNMLAKLRGSKDQGRKESAKVDQYVRDLNKAKMVARDALIAFRKGNLAEIAAAQQAEVQAQGVAASSRQADIDPKPASAADVRKAQAYERENGILPYTSAGQIEVPIGVEVGPILFSIKQEGKYGNHPLFDIPVNKNGTVTLYYPATNAEARRVARDKTLRAAPGSNRIYLTNESSAPRVMENPGNIEQTLEGANVLVQVDPGLLQLDMEHADGRKDFFIPLAEGKEFFRKMRMTRLFTQNAPRTKALTKDTKLTDLERRIDDGVKKYLSLTKAEQRVRLKEARTLLKREHNVTTLLGVNGKLEKTNTGGYGLNNYDGKDVKSMGLGLASAQKINENNLSTCPKSAICESLCLGETSGQNLLYGGDGQYKSGPRLSQYLKTEAMVVHPEEFAVVLHSEIAKLQRDAKKEDYQATVRLNVTSDFRPQTFKGIIEAFPDVMFYDYTKLPSKSIADNHHLTYSSTGASQVVNGKTIVNPESNWNKMVEVMRRGDNVAMAFSDKNTMPAYVVDEKSGERFQVWNGDNYDARFLDPKPGQEGNEFGKGMIIGLTNKDRTGKPEQAAEKNRGFFIDYNPERDGDTVVIKNQDFLAANTKFVPIKVERRAAATDDVPTMSRRQAETIDVGGIDLPLNDDGTVTLYHHTSKESAKLIRQSGILRAKAEPDVYMTTRRETDTGYGDTAVALRVPPDHLMLDDEFPDGRADFRIDVGRPGGSIRVKVEPDAGDDIRFSRRQPSTLDDVKAVWSEAGIDGDVFESRGRILLSKIVVPQDRRSAGAGTAAMQALVDYADRTSQRIDLTPSADYGGNKKRLVEFYKRFGFVENKGRNKDYEVSEAMYRPAQADNIRFSRRQAETIEVDGVERPTLNSNGQPIHSTEDGLRNFWRWFGDSKVVDEQGRPQIVYHVSRNGSPNVFKTEGNMASGFKLDASFFASDRLYAEEYAKVIGASQYDIGEFYLSSTNPLSRQMSPREFSDPPVEAKIIKEAREAGNDAVQFLGDQEYGEAFWAVFNPNQIKSATDNSGTFDPENPDIRFSARQAEVEQDPELITIFEGLQSGRGLKGVRAREAAAAHPLGDAIQKVHNDFYDILERLDNAGLIEINC